MELPDNLSQFKSEFAKQIAMEEEKARNLNIWLLKGQHVLKRGISESVLGKEGKQRQGQLTALNTSKLHSSVGSLPSLLVIDKLVNDEEDWVTTEQFKEILDQKEKEISQVKYPDKISEREGGNNDIQRLEEENAELRKQLEMSGSRSSNASLMGLSKYQELERDVAKLQAKICKMDQTSEHPSSTRRLVTFLENFKSQLPQMDSPGGMRYESVLDRTGLENFRPSVDSYISSVPSYRPSIESTRRPSMGSYRAACHPRDEHFRPQPSRAESCVAQFSRINDGGERFEGVSEKSESFGLLLGSDDSSSCKYDKVDEAGMASEFRGQRPCFPRSRVVMGAKSVQRARESGGRMGESCRAFSSSNLLGDCRTRKDFPYRAEEVVGEKPPKLDSSMRSRSKSCSMGLSYREAVEVGCGDSGRGTDISQSSYSSVEMEKGNTEDIDVKKDIGKDESKVHKFFKRLRKFVSKDAKSSHEKEQEDVKGTRKMTRSLSHRIGKPKNLPKRLKSFHCSSSPRLRKDFYLN